MEHQPTGPDRLRTGPKITLQAFETRSSGRHHPQMPIPSDNDSIRANLEGNNASHRSLAALKFSIMREQKGMDLSHGRKTCRAFWPHLKEIIEAKDDHLL